MLIGPIPFFTAAYGFLYETPVAKRQSIQVGCSILGEGLAFRILQSGSSLYGSQTLETGIELQFAYKFYLSKKRRVAPRGWYAGPLIRFTSGGVGTDYDYRIKNYYLEFEQFDYNLIFGTQMIRRSGRGFVVDFYLGAGYKNLVTTQHFSATYSAPYSVEGNTLLSTHFNFLIGINFGWGFCPRDPQ